MDAFDPDALPAAGRQPICTVCGRRLGIFAEDQPDWPNGPLCGDCYQAQQADDETFWDELEEDA